MGTSTHESSGTTTLEATTAISNLDNPSETTTFEAITTSSVDEPSSHTTELETTTATSVVETAATSDAYTTTMATEEAHTTTDIIMTATSDEQTTTTVASETQTTTDIITTTTLETETTTTAAEAIPTFQIIGSGGAADGAALQGHDNPDAIALMFNPGPSNGFRPRTYILEPGTGRVKDRDNGRYLCGNYQWSNTVDPAYTFACSGTPGPNQINDYLTCRIVRGKLLCTVPQTICYQEEIGLEVTCETSSSNEIFDHLYLTVVGEQYILIGRGGLGSAYVPIDLIAQEV